MVFTDFVTLEWKWTFLDQQIDFDKWVIGHYHFDTQCTKFLPHITNVQSDQNMQVWAISLQSERNNKTWKVCEVKNVQQFANGKWPFLPDTSTFLKNLLSILLFSILLLMMIIINYNYNSCSTDSAGERHWLSGGPCLTLAFSIFFILLDLIKIHISTNTILRWLSK